MSREEHVKKLEKIINELSCIQPMMPIEYETDLNVEKYIVSRTGGSLYLTCNQGVVLFNRAKTKLNAERAEVAAEILHNFHERDVVTLP